MNRCVHRRPSFLTEILACALIPLTGSGCAMIDNFHALTNLIESGPVPTADFDAAAKHANVTDNSPPHDETGPAEHPFPATLEKSPIPIGRLLNPDFSLTGISQTNSSAGGHSISEYEPSNTDAIIQTSVEPVFQADRSSEPVTDRTPAVSEPEVVETIDAGPVTQGNTDDTGVISTDTESIDANSIRNQFPGESGIPPPSQEQSVLERLRSLAPGSFTPERSPRQFVRQLERISNPLQWDLFGNRDNPESPHQPLSDVMVNQQIPSAGTQVAANSEHSGDLLEALISELENEIQTWPQTDGGSPLQPEEFRRRQLNLRLLRLTAGQPAAAAEAIDSMTSEEKTFWQDLILAISRFHKPDKSMKYDEHVAATIGQFRTAVRHLEPLSSLSIRRLDFCSRIHGFGSIDTFLTNTFEPGKRLLIYAEVDNLKSEVSPLGTYRTSFGGTLQIWSESSDEPIEIWDLPSVNDDSATRRSDYYLSYNFTLPAHLSEGNYEVRLQIRDDISARTADSVLKFAVQ